MNHNLHRGRNGSGVAVFVSVVCLLVVGWLAYSWWLSPERAIKRRLKDLGATLSVPANDTELGRVARVARLRGYLAEDIHLRAGGQQLASREALLAVAAGFMPSGGLTVEPVDVQVAVGPDTATAEVYLDVKLTSPGSTGGPIVDAHEGKVTMAKRNGEWVITDAESQQTLTRP